MAFEPNKPMRNIRFGAKDPTTDVVQWICRDMIGTLSHATCIDEAHVYPSLTEDELTKIIEYIAENFPGYSIGIFEVTAH